MIYTLENVRSESIKNNPVKRSKVIGEQKMYMLHQDVEVLLSNNELIFIPKGFTWDRASVPQIFHSVIRPDGDDDIAFLIHDFLYVNKMFTRKFNDNEMMKWAKAMKGTKKVSFRNWDIRVKRDVVRLFGWTVWNKRKQKK